MSLVQQSEHAHEVYNELVHTLSLARRHVIVSGRLLYELFTKNLYKKALGEGVEEWDDFLKIPEISLSRGEAQRMMDIYTWFVLELGYSEDELTSVPVKSLHYLLPLAKEEKYQRDEMDELLEDARVLHQSDFRERVYELRSPGGEKTYEYMVMRKCHQTGTMQKVHAITDEQVRQAFNIGHHD